MRSFRTGLTAAVVLQILTQGTLAQTNPAPLTPKMVEHDMHELDYLLDKYRDFESALKDITWNSNLGGHLSEAKKAAAGFQQ